ncbi:hypothetical protein BV22DRAFT_113595 [Leucogyrophana mollusca]|uniref:Uncharacterized protein n=1 Tax=Leucogyrophana mollusca TaxID=85980 RepID=A0ACB8BVW3_9AGAM|nr:hypothetical protein BV22DRAFT_113595 [Leucogyrophana mollusca]
MICSLTCWGPDLLGHADITRLHEIAICLIGVSVGFCGIDNPLTCGRYCAKSRLDSRKIQSQYLLFAGQDHRALDQISCGCHTARRARVLEGSRGSWMVPTARSGGSARMRPMIYGASTVLLYACFHFDLWPRYRLQTVLSIVRRYNGTRASTC